MPLPQDGLADGLVPPISALSPGVGFESLSTVHPILAGLGVGEEGLLSSLSPAPSGSGQPKAKRMKTDKLEKDRNAPKKPANAFLMFCQQQRNTVQEEYFKVCFMDFFIKIDCLGGPVFRKYPHPSRKTNDQTWVWSDLKNPTCGNLAWRFAVESLRKETVWFDVTIT